MDRLWVVLLVCLLVGCGGRDPNRKETVPVTGLVTVNGSPAQGVMVMFHPIAGMDKAQPTVTKSITDDQGKFSAATYELNDGVPPGEYKLTFTWGKFNTISMSFDGDQLKGKYADPKTSEHKAIVLSGKPSDLGTFNLKK